jgi:hypothetical protein
MVGKLGVTTAFFVIYLITLEVFPTAIRASMLGLCSTGARIGSMSSSYIGKLVRQYTGSFIISLELFFEPSSWFDTTLCDTVFQWLATRRWFFPGTPISSTNKTDRRDITAILLKVALNTITLTPSILPDREFCFPLRYLSPWYFSFVLSLCL